MHQMNKYVYAHIGIIYTYFLNEKYNWDKIYNYISIYICHIQYFVYQKLLRFIIHEHMSILSLI